MDQFERRPHPLRQIWRWCGVAFIAIGVIDLVTHDKPDNTFSFFLFGAIALAASFFVKWKRKVDD